MSSKSFQNASKLNGIVSVLQFGAVGDGVASDTAAIQAAIDSISESGGALHFPAGTYIIGSTLNISNKPVSIFGDGIGVSILKWTGVGMVGQNGINYTNASFEPLLLQDLSIKAFPNPSNVTQVAGIALNVVYPSEETKLEPTVKLLRVEIRPEQSGATQQGGWSTCVYAKDAGRFSANNCNFASRTPLGTKGIHISTGVNAFFPVINNCDFTLFEDAIYSSGPASPGGTVIESSNFSSCYRGITIDVPTDMLIASSNYFQVYRYGIYAKARTAFITQNRIDGYDNPYQSHPVADLYGIRIDGTSSGPYDGGVISNNNIERLSAEAMDGILLDGIVIGTSVTGNTLGTHANYGQILRRGIFTLNGATQNCIQNNIAVNVTNFVFDGSLGNIVKDNYGAFTGSLPLSGATPVIQSGAFNQVLRSSIYLTQASPTNVTDFLNGYDNQVVTIIAGDNNSTIIHDPNLILLSGFANYSMTGNKTLTLLRSGSAWREISRS